MMFLSDIGISFLQAWEGLRLHAYADSGGIWTIGYGHTGLEAYNGASITQERATQLFKQDLRKAETVVNNAVKVPLKQHQFDTLVSFAYNVGTGSFRSSTLLQELNQGSYSAVPVQLKRWDKATVHGQLTRIPGLTNRRNGEIQLWFTP